MPGPMEPGIHIPWWHLMTGSTMLASARTTGLLSCKETVVQVLVTLLDTLAGLYVNFL